MKQADAHQRILRFIQDFQAERGYPPTMDEIAAAVGLRAKSQVAGYIKSMIGNGLLAPRPNVRACWPVPAGLSANPAPARRDRARERLADSADYALDATDLRILRFIGNFQRDYGYRPNYREIRAALHLPSISVVCDRLRELIEVGVVAPVANGREPYRILIGLPPGPGRD